MFAKRSIFYCVLVLVLLAGLGACQPPSMATSPPATETDPPTPTSTAGPPTPVPTFAPLEDFHKGIGFGTTFRGDFLLPDVRWVIEEQIKPLGATWIIIVFDCKQEPEISPEIDCEADFAPTDEGVINVIQTAHENGLRVFLKPQIFGSVDPSPYMDMSNLNQETYWDEWFEHYTAFILHYAEMAREYDVDLFGVGSEDAGVVHFTDEWREVIAEVRKVYPGPLIYAAATVSIDADVVQFWDNLDYIGADTYWPLSNSPAPTVEELVEDWQEPAARLDQLYETWGKPIIFTEAGYRSAEGSAAHPEAMQGVFPVDMKAQADAIESVFQVFGEKPWWQGVYWFAWDANHLQGGFYDIQYTAQAKPAENLLRHHYGAPPRDLEESFVIPEAFENEEEKIIYDDARGTSWSIETWDIGNEGVFLDLENESVVHSGSKAIAVVLDSPGALVFSIFPNVIEKYDYLEFYINLGSESRHTLIVNLMSPKISTAGPGTSYAMLGNYALVDRTKPLPLNEWFLVRIPISDLNRADMNPEMFEINNWGTAGEPSSVFYLDDIRLVREDSP